MPYRYLTLSELIYLNGCILGDEQIATGKRKVRDVVLLQAAEQRPQASAFGADAYPTLYEKAAALLHALARNHPFTDGNKRTAAMAAAFMLRVNGHCVAWDQADALIVIVEVAENHRPLDELAAWFVTTPCDPLPDPDVERDSAVIADLLTDQKWLLDELVTR